MRHSLTRAIFLLFLFLYSGNAFAAECEHVFKQHYGTGFQAEIQITNTGTTTIPPTWSVTWSYSDGTAIPNVWNANSSGTNPVTATPPVWASGIAPGDTYSIGMNGRGPGEGVVITSDICEPDIVLPIDFRLAKAWVDGEQGDEITVSTTGLTNNATLSSVNTGASNTTSGGSVVAIAGDVITLPTETFVAGASANYTASDWVCDNHDESTVTAGDTLTISPLDSGKSITCTITNTYVDPNAPPPVPSDVSCEHSFSNHYGSGFQGRIDITNISSSPIDSWTVTWSYSDGSVVSSVYNAVAVGSNPITATEPSYFTTLAPGASTNVAFGARGAGVLDSIVCSTGTAASAQPISLTLSKQLINDHGGQATETDWVLEANVNGGAAELSGTDGVTSSTLVAGDYELSETGPAGYVQRSLDCDAGVLVGTTLTIASGDDINCVFSNDDQPVRLTLLKTVANNAGTATATDWVLDAASSGVTVLNGVSGVSSSSLSAGDFVLTESGGPAGYSLDSLTCNAGVFDDSSNTLTLSNGESATCTFANQEDVVVLPVVKSVDLAVVKSVNDQTPNIGDVINFTLEVSNLGPDPASNVVVDDILPAGLALVIGSMAGGDGQSQVGSGLQWTINDIGVGNNLTLQYQATVLAVP